MRTGISYFKSLAVSFPKIVDGGGFEWDQIRLSPQENLAGGFFLLPYGWENSRRRGSVNVSEGRKPPPPLFSPLHAQFHLMASSFSFPLFISYVYLFSSSRAKCRPLPSFATEHLSPFRRGTEYERRIVFFFFLSFGLMRS